MKFEAKPRLVPDSKAMALYAYTKLYLKYLRQSQL